MRGALTARGTRRESVHGGSLAASMPPRVAQPARTPRQRVNRLLSLKRVARLAVADAPFVACVLKARLLLGLRRENGQRLIERLVIRPAHVMRRLHYDTDHLDWSLPAHRRGTLRGVHAA
ncbi:hypothetical protein XarbCFBP8152_18045 [Xanthomonas arboricola]|nr:hypothetical protein XarbCFBP8152_18045 [Xanthomonas arboricola]